MPTYEVDLSDGRTVTLESDSDPTEQDIFDALNVYELVGNSQVEPQSPAMADDRAARKQELAMQQQAIANEGVPEIWKAGAYSHSALARGMQAPKDIIQSATKIGRMLPGYKIARGAADVIGEAVLPDSVNQYRKELVEGFDRQNDEYFTKMAEWENWMAERDAMLGEPGIPTQIAAATARGFAELPTQMLASGTGAAGSLANAAPAIGGQTLAALRGSSIGAGAVSGLQRFAQEKAEGTDDLTALNRAAISGTINGLVTRMFGATGIESIFRSEGPRGVAKKVADVLLQGASEGAEELTAQIVDDITDMMGKNPNMTFGDVVKNALISGVVGSVLGGGVSGLHQTVQPSQRDVAPRQPFNIDELNRTLEENYRGDAAAAQPSVPEISDERGKELQNKFFMSENMSREEVSELESYTEQLSRKSVAGADGLNGVETARLQSLQDRFYTGQDMPGEEVAEMDRLLKKSAFAKDPKTGVSRFVDIINQAIAEEGGEGLFDIDDTGEGSKSNSPRYGNNAWYNEQTGRLVISPEVIAGELMGVPPEKRRAKLKRIINEEIKHKGTKASDAEAFASDATLAERIIATKIYTGSFRGKLHGGGRLTRRNLGYEMIRQRLQKMEGLEITELVGLARTEGWTLKSLDILSDVIARSRQAFNTKASQRQLEILERSADKVARLRKAMVEAGVGGEERKEGAGPASIARLTPDDVINSKRGDLSVGPDEIDSMSDEDLSDLFTRKKEGGAPAYSPQYGSTLWGSMQSEDVVPKLERMRDAAKDRMMAELAKGKDTDMKKFMSEQSKMLWHSGAIEGAKRRGGNFTSAIKTKLGVELTGDPEADNLEFTITDEKSPASGRKFTVERRATVDQIEESKRQIEREVSGETGPASESSLSKEAIDSLGLRYDGGYGRLENYTVTDRNSPAFQAMFSVPKGATLEQVEAKKKLVEGRFSDETGPASLARLSPEEIREVGQTIRNSTLASDAIELADILEHGLRYKQDITEHIEVWIEGTEEDVKEEWAELERIEKHQSGKFLSRQIAEASDDIEKINSVMESAYQYHHWFSYLGSELKTLGSPEVEKAPHEFPRHTIQELYEIGIKIKNRDAAKMFAKILDFAATAKGHPEQLSGKEFSSKGFALVKEASAIFDTLGDELSESDREYLETAVTSLVYEMDLVNKGKGFYPNKPSKPSSDDSGIQSFPASMSQRAIRRMEELRKLNALRKGLETGETEPAVKASSKRLAVEPATPQSLTEGASNALAADVPSFMSFVGMMRSKHGFGVQPGHLAETWADEVWKYLGTASGERLKHLVDKLGLRRQVFGAIKSKGSTVQLTGDIADPSSEESKRTPQQVAAELSIRLIDRADKLQAKADATYLSASKEVSEAATREARLRADGISQKARMLRGQAERIQEAAKTGEGLPMSQEYFLPGMDSPQSSYVQGTEGGGKQRPEIERGKTVTARSRAMAAIGRALLDQIPSEGKSLTRKEIGPEDVRWSQLGSEIYKVTREDLEDLDTLGMQLTQGAGSNAATRRVTAGGRDIETREALPRSATKRVVAFLDNVTGKVFLVSAYRDGRRGPVFLDPGSVTGEHRTLEQLKRYRPLYSIPIDSPVKELRQEFSSFKEFSDKFHRQVQAIARRVGWRGFGTEPDIEATEGFEGEGGVAMGPDADLMRIALGLGEGELESSEQLTEPESRVLYQMFSPVERYEDVQYLMGSLRQRIASRADAARNFERWYQLDDERIRAEEERQTAPSKVAKKLDERIANIKSKMDEIAESGDWRLNPKDQLAMVAISKVLRSVGDEVSGEGMTSGEIADLAIQRIYEAAQRTKTERAFVALSQREFAKGREVPGVAGQQAEWKSPFTRELTMLSRRPPTDTSRAEPGQPMITTSAEKGRPAGLSVEREEKLRLRRSKSEPSNYPGMIPVPLQSIPKDVLKAGTVLDYTKQRRPSKRAVVESGGRVAEPVSYPETGEDINPPATVRYEVSPQKRAQIEREINERIDRIEAKAAREAARPQPASQQEMQLGEGGERNVDLPREPRQQDLGLGPASMRRVAPSSMSEQTHNILTDFGSIYDSWMSDRIREHGGNNARAAANVFDSIIDREKELYGGLSTLLNRARRLAGGIEPSTATSLSGKVREIPGRIKGSAKALAAVNWLNKLEKVTKDAASVRLVNAIESKIKNVPAYVRPALDALQGANMEIGLLLQRVVPGFRAGGKFQRNMTSLGYDIIRNGGGDLWNKWVYGTAKANNVPVGDVKRHFAKMKAALDDPATSGAELEQVNQDFARRYPNVITHVKNRFGWHPVIHSEAFGYLENAARRATHITAFREEFPMDKDGRKSFAMLMEALKKELTPEVQDDLDALVRSLNGHPTDDYSSRTLRDMRLGPQQFWGQALRMANATINGLMAKAVLTLQPVTQTGELLFGSTPVFLGMRQYLRAAMRAKELYRIMEITGSVNRVMSDYTFNRNAPIRSLFRSSGNVLSKVFANNALNELQEALAATTARITAEDISTGNLSDWQKQMLPDTLRKMGFDKRHVAGIMKGDPQMLAMFIRRAPAWLTAGNRSGAESGRLGSSRMFNSVFRFQSYPMMKANQSRKVLVDFVDAWSGHSGPGTKKAATKSLARFVAGNAMQGAVTAMLASLAYNGLMGLRIKEEEIKDEPFKFLFDSFLASTSGPAYMLYRGMSESGLGGIGKQASKVVFPYAISKELYDMSTGAEKYKDLSVGDRIGKFLQSKTPGTRLLAAGAAMAGLSNEDRELDAAMSALFRWKSSELGFTDNDRHLKKDERAKFRKHIRRAVEAMKEGDSSAFTSEWMSAVGETSTDAVSQSLSARKVLKGPNGRELTEDEKSSLRRRIGMEAYNKLEYYDLMLEFAADGVMLPRPSR